MARRTACSASSPANRSNLSAPPDPRGSGGADNSGGENGRIDNIPDYVDRWLSYRCRALDLPGFAYAVGRAGAVVRSGAHGVADLGSGTPMTVGHRFRIASQSKMFTATAVVLLAKA